MPTISNVTPPNEPTKKSTRCEAVKAWGTLAIAAVLVILCMAALALPFALYGGDKPPYNGAKDHAPSLPACILAGACISS